MSYVVRLEYAYGVCPKCKCGNYLRYLIHKDGLIHKPYEIKCINCNSYFTKEAIFGNGEETTPKPMTNYDRLISKTPEELAEMFSKKLGCNECPWVLKNCDNRCKDAWLSWLKSPVEVDNGKTDI